jgi:hypothetical protein
MYDVESKRYVAGLVAHLMAHKQCRTHIVHERSYADQFRTYNVQMYTRIFFLSFEIINVVFMFFIIIGIYTWEGKTLQDQIPNSLKLETPQLNISYSLLDGNG